MLASNELVGEKLPDDMTVADLLALVWKEKGLRCADTLAIRDREGKPTRTPSPEFVGLEELIDRVQRKLAAQVDSAIESSESEPKPIRISRRAKRTSRNAASGK